MNVPGGFVLEWIERSEIKCYRSLMRKLLFIGFIVLGPIMTFADVSKPNDLVKFLAGKWENTSFEVLDGKPVKKEEYPETMVIKNENTVTITAHGYRDGKDLTKDMRLEVVGDKAVMSQGSLTSKGHREDNVYYFSGTQDGTEYRFRIYAMGDKFVFHRETWKGGKIQQVDMSYLVRK